ncbi:hypothetical protein SKAU_G00372140 [Synaphobranchus kaupii]|uniref:Uncharacterized protein n=1 Tax=Synaphobranchus kaupii TaxID=118154 RepID=A0A9Q1IDY3_SYNKA|nr:hypothetical protein SKAU_G00372140 [Synaphobranchus kaupii]
MDFTCACPQAHASKPKNNPKLFSSSCLHTGTTWHLGSDCGIAINKAGLFAGTSVVAAAILVAIGVLATYLIVFKKKERRNRDNKGAIIDQWLEDDFEWPSPDRTTDIYTGIFQNPYNTEGGQNIYQQENTPTYNPHPSLRISDAPRLHFPNEPQIQLHNMPSSFIRTSRPNMYTSSQI